MDSAVSAERMLYPQFVLKNTACKEVLLIIPKNQQHTLHSKSLSHMLFLFSWLLPNMGHNLLSLTTALMFLPNTGSPFPKNSCTELQGARGAQPPERWSALMGAEGIQIFMRAGPSFRNQTQNSYFCANSLANKNSFSLKPRGENLRSLEGPKSRASL